MKILFLPAHYIYDDHQYGSELDLTYNIVNRIVQKNTESVVVTGKKNLINTPDYRVIEVQPNTKGFDMSFMNAVKFNIRYTKQAFKLLRSEKFDALHHVRPFAIGATFNLAVLMGAHKNIPFVIGAFCSPYADKEAGSVEGKRVIRDALSHGFERVTGLVLNGLSDATLRKADVVFVIDKLTQKLVKERAPNVKVVVAPPGKDKNKFTYNASKKFKKGELVFISAGNFIPRKGLDKLIEAFSKVASTYPKARLKLVGSGYEEPRLRTLVKNLHLVDQVIFAPRVSNKDMPAIYAAADVYVAMPTAEAFGHVYIEALASGLPVVATRTVGVDEILGDRAFGKVISQGDVAAMASRMEYFLSHPEVLPKLAADARTYFENKFDWGIIIPRYIKVYEKLLLG
jgi:glycosyltransferase involved in cell wall biosynthesis